MDCLMIESLCIPVCVGVYPDEQNGPQPVRMTLTLGLPGTAMFTSDNLQDTIDYSRIVHQIKDLGLSRHFSLIEYFAEQVAAMLMQEFRVPWIRLHAAKVNVVPEAASVGVSIMRGHIAPSTCQP